MDIGKNIEDCDMDMVEELWETTDYNIEQTVHWSVRGVIGMAIHIPVAEETEEGVFFAVLNQKEWTEKQ